MLLEVELWKKTKIRKNDDGEKGDDHVTFFKNNNNNVGMNNAQSRKTKISKKICLFNNLFNLNKKRKKRHGEFFFCF